MSSIGLQIAVLVGTRVAGQLTYIPAHTKNGKNIPAQCKIPVYVNSSRGTNQRTGNPGRVDSYVLTAWGKLADTCCRSCPPGKEISIVGTPQSYQGRLFNQDGSLRLDSMGQPITTTKHGLTINQISFGSDSAKHIQNEIQRRKRPADWNIQGSPGWNAWVETLRRRQQQVWDGKSQTFGWARVVIPQGPGIVLNFTQPAPQHQTQAPQYQTAQYQTQAPQYQTAQYQTQAPQYQAPQGNFHTPEQLVSQHFNQMAGGGDNDTPF